MTFEFSYFVDLLNEYGFKSGVFPFKERNFEFLGDRFDLFQKIFLSQDNIDLDKETIYYTSPILNQFNNPIITFYLLYHAIYSKYLLLSKDISDIFMELYNQWINSFNNQEIPLNFIIPIPAFSIRKDFTISEDILLRDILSHFRIEKISQEELKSTHILWEFIDDGIVRDFDDYFDLIGTCLLYNTNLSYIYYENKNEKNLQRLKEEFNYIELILKQVINTFYLLGFDFKYYKYTINYPWWFIPYIKKYQEFKTESIFAPALEEDEKLRFLDLYKTVVKSKIFVDKTYRMIMGRYHQIFNRDRPEDIILDAFIVFEWLFTRNMRAELSYRLSLNISLFISSDWEEFKRINDFIKDLYDLRSSIVHGGNWIKEAKKLGKPNEVLKELKAVLNKCIIRFVELIIEDSNILKRFEDKYYFFEISQIFEK